MNDFDLTVNDVWAVHNKFIHPNEWYFDDWREDAACLGMDQEAFFPEIDITKGGRVGDYKRQEQIAMVQTALDTCKTCPVRQHCLNTSIIEGNVDGIWGGMTDKQRYKHIRSLFRWVRCANRNCREIFWRENNQKNFCPNCSLTTRMEDGDYTAH